MASVASRSEGKASLNKSLDGYLNERKIIGEKYPEIHSNAKDRRDVMCT